MDYFKLVLGILFVWRITHLLNAEDGPWQMFARLRRTAGTGFWGQLLDCFYCLSLWMAAPLTLLLGTRWQDRLLLWPALSAGAILIERLTQKKEFQLQDFYREDLGPDEVEDQEDRHVLR